MNKKSEGFHLIFEDGDSLRAEVVRSVLEAGEVDCFIENEGCQNLFSMGSMGGLNPLMGTVKVYIRPEDRERAEALLADLPPLPEQPGDARQDASPETPGSGGQGFLSRLRQWFK